MEILPAKSWTAPVLDVWKAKSRMTQSASGYSSQTGGSLLFIIQSGLIWNLELLKNLMKLSARKELK